MCLYAIRRREFALLTLVCNAHAQIALTRLPVGHTHNDLDAKFGVFNFKVLPDGKRANRQWNIKTPKQFEAATQKVFNQPRTKRKYPAFRFCDLPHTWDWTAFLADCMPSPFPFQFSNSGKKDHSWDKLQMAFARDADTGNCILRHADPHPGSPFGPSEGYKILTKLPDVDVGPGIAAFKMYNNNGKVAKKGDTDGVHWIDTVLGKIIATGMNKVCDTEEEKQEWKDFFENTPRTAAAIKAEDRLVWKFPKEEDRPYRHARAAVNLLADLVTRNQNEMLLGDQRLRGQQTQEDQENDTGEGAQKEQESGSDDEVPNRMLRLYVYPGALILAVAQAVRERWERDTEEFPFWSGSKLENREDFPDYKLPFQIVKVLGRKDGAELAPDNPDRPAVHDYITDPDLIVYNVQYFTTDCRALDGPQGWMESLEFAKNTAWIPEKQGNSQRNLFATMVQSQLMWGPKDMNITRQKKIDKRKHRQLKEALESYEEKERESGMEE